MTYDLNSPFNYKKHRETFINYLEVVVFPDGHIEYAVPSHTKKLEEIYADMLKIDIEEVPGCCPENMVFDYIEWLIGMTNCVSVWNDFIIGSPNKSQRKAIVKLKNMGLYKGKI